MLSASVSATVPIRYHGTGTSSQALDDERVHHRKLCALQHDFSHDHRFDVMCPSHALSVFASGTMFVSQPADISPSVCDSACQSTAYSTLYADAGDAVAVLHPDSTQLSLDITIRVTVTAMPAGFRDVCTEGTRFLDPTECAHQLFLEWHARRSKLCIKYLLHHSTVPNRFGQPDIVIEEICAPNLIDVLIDDSITSGYVMRAIASQLACCCVVLPVVIQVVFHRRFYYTCIWCCNVVSTCLFECVAGSSSCSGFTFRYNSGV